MIIYLVRVTNSFVMKYFVFLWKNLSGCSLNAVDTVATMTGTAHLLRKFLLLVVREDSVTQLEPEKYFYQ